MIVVNNDRGNGTIQLWALVLPGGLVTIPVGMIGNLNGNIVIDDLG